MFQAQDVLTTTAQIFEGFGVDVSITLDYWPGTGIVYRVLAREPEGREIGAIVHTTAAGYTNSNWDVSIRMGARRLSPAACQCDCHFDNSHWTGCCACANL